MEEAPIEQIEGRVTAGSINIDGTSAVRRSCSLTMIAKELNINDFYWGLKTKFKLEIGVENKVDANYPDIIWFPEGVYVITGFNTSVQTNNYTISISGKDKMCLLNGELGGSLPSSVDFGKIEEITYDYYLLDPPSVDPNNKYLSAERDHYWYNEDKERYEKYIASAEYPSDRLIYTRGDTAYSTIIDYPIRDIIFEAVHAWGGEPMHNIVVNDIESNGLELLEYKGENTLYMFRNVGIVTIPYEFQDATIEYDPNSEEDFYIYDEDTADYKLFDKSQNPGNLTLYRKVELDEVRNPGTGVFENINIDGELFYYLADDCDYEEPPFQIKNFAADGRIFDHLQEPMVLDATEICFKRKGIARSIYTVSQKVYGDTVGYRTTDLTYPGDLIANVGEALTSILDKIKNMLGDFEYFYDLDGRFVFQKKQIYVNTSWLPLTTNEDGSVSADTSGDMYVDVSVGHLGVAYEFHNGNLITTFQNNPQLNNLKNDYSVWGVRKGITGVDLPIHLRYAIDKKPTYYKNTNGDVFTTSGTYSYTYPKRPVPACLDQEKWWEVRDWANYYYLLTGHYPDLPLSYYANLKPGDRIIFSNEEQYKLWVTNRRISQYEYWYYHNNQLCRKLEDGTYVRVFATDPWYPNSQYFRAKHNFAYMNLENFFPRSNRASWSNPNKPLAIFDIYPDGSLYYTGHNPNDANSTYYCTHTLSYFINNAEKYDVLSYIYDPVIPYHEELIEQKVQTYDWREIIYQMAKDYRQNGHEDDFNVRLKENNGLEYPTGYTGYEQYYTDLEGFWRQLYNPDLPTEYVKSNLTLTEDSWKNTVKSVDIYLGDYVYEADGTVQVGDPLNVNYYYLKDGKYVLYEEEVYPKNGPTLYKRKDEYVYTLQTEDDTFDDEAVYYEKVCYYHPENFWHYDVIGGSPYGDPSPHPDQLNFWFDFLDTEGELGQFSVPAVGHRIKAVNDNSVKSIYYEETPTVLYINSQEFDRDNIESGYTYIFTQPNMENLFRISSRGKSAKEAVDDLLYQHSYCIESVTITAIPIYYLQPNSRIYIRDDNSKIDGEYIVSKITIPLAYNGTMSITATKAAERIN